MGQLEQMFLGEYSHTIDDKGRLTIPAKYRGELAAGLVITRGLDHNLIIFPLESWHQLAEKVNSHPFSDSKLRAFRRRIFSGAADLEPDRQGRIVVPAHLREFAGIETDVVVSGMHSYVEVWSAESWASERNTLDASDDAERWDDLGI
jgi:MraZ protein